MTCTRTCLFPDNIHWEGVEYPEITIEREDYKDKDPIYFRDGRDHATPKKGLVMVDAGISWVADQIRQMTGKT
ncbi:MAG: hypothetical protein QGH37_22860 [Candidatus Poribacteria bacterium]|nr:hypothetical protein [Candidatus Poribacteria bacterium]MDP6961289.1 hypothetical protein [Dehalococcoidia bacterium]